MTSSSGTAATIVSVVLLIGLFLVLLYALILFSRIWKKRIQNRIVSAVKRRRNTNDLFRKEYGYSWDYVIVFKVYDDKEAVNDYQCEYSFKTILERLSAGGLEIRLFYSLKHHEVFCKIRCPLARLQKQADLINYLLLFDEDKLKETCKQGREGFWDPLKIPEHCEETHLNPYAFIYGRYEFDTETQRTCAELVDIYKKYTPQISFLAEELHEISNTNENTMKSPRGSLYLLTNNPLKTNPSTEKKQSMIEVTSLKSSDDNVTLPSHQGLEPPSQVAVVPSLSSDPISMNSFSKEEEATVFRGVDRLKIIHSIITSKSSGCCGLDIRRLLKYNSILAYIPLHDAVEVLTLQSEWLTFFDPPWRQPVTKIRNYFGEKVGLYFLFLGIYTSWLSISAVLGLGFWINVASAGNNPNTQSIPYFMGIMSIWTVLFLEHWKRCEKKAAMKWGMVGFENAEVVRPQFYGDPIRSPITGKFELYYPDEKRDKIVFQSQIVICLMILGAIGVTAAIFVLRKLINTSSKATVGGVEAATIIASLLFAAQIQIFNEYFNRIALKLNNRENHRTDTEFEDALIAKTFTFQFVNSYVCLFYIAFLKPFIPDIDPCSSTGCLEELQVTLGTILLSQMTIGNITEVGMPMLIQYWTNRRQTDRVNRIQRFEGVMDLKKLPTHSEEGFQISDIIDINENQLASLDLKTDISEVERVFRMLEYDVLLGAFNDYSELVIQFGFSTMFVAAFPLATVLSFMNNYVEIRVDGWKLCQLYRRVQPRPVEDIGTWMDILQFLSICATLVNSGLVAFTSLNMIDYTWDIRIWTFILMAGGLLIIREVIAFVIPDVPEYVNIQIKRQEYIQGKVVENIEDEDEDALISHTHFGIPNYIIDNTDFDPL